MRHRVALVTMALGIMAAGSARAHDATQVIYDLSALRTQVIAAPAPRASHEYQLPTHNLPISTPSLGQHPGDGLGISDGDNLELRQRPHGHLQAIGVGSPRGKGIDSQPTNNPSPTPEPGTFLLLGGALASGARFMRRRLA